MTEKVSLEAAIEVVLRYGPTFETIAGLCKMAVEASQKSADEPVARVVGYYAGRCVIEPLDRAMVMPDNMALYAHPQPKREWLGLTDEEILGAACDHYNPHQRPEVSFARMIEAKLKEKNHG